MSRKGPDKNRRLLIGHAVWAARLQGEPWKRIEDWFAYRKTRLYQFMQEAKKVLPRPCDHKKRSHITIYVHEHKPHCQGAGVRSLTET